MKKDYERVLSSNKLIESEYRDERERGVSTKGDVSYLKKVKWLELEKQKNELMIIFREK
jgi:hypothetical protein